MLSNILSLSIGSGKECQLEDICPFLPCHNNGTCLGRPGSYVCECVKPWTGTNCTLCEDRYGLRGDQCGKMSVCLSI